MFLIRCQTAHVINLLAMMHLRGWRLFPDSSADPHAEAARYALGGRPVMACYILREAMAKEPDRDDLRVHLRRIEAATRLSSAPALTPAIVSNFFVSIHVLVAWLCFGCSIALPLAIPAYLVVRFVPAMSHPGYVLPGFQWVLAIAIAWIVAAAWLSIKLFARVWFAYLRLLPELHALAADAALPSVMNIQVVGAPFSSVRRDFFMKRYGTFGAHDA